VKKIESINGFLNLKINQDGEGNFHFLKPSEDTTKTDFEFDLESIRLINFRYQFHNKKNGQYQEILVDDIQLEGDFNADEYDVKSTAKGEIRTLSTGPVGFIKNRRFNTNVNMHVEDNTYFTFTESNLQLEEMNFKVDGMVSSDSINLDIKGDDITLQEFVNSFSGQIFNDVYSYQANGVVDFDFSLKGAYKNLKLLSHFKIKEGEIVEPGNQIEVRDINLEGTYKQSPEGNSLNFPKFDLKIFNGFLKGSALITDLRNPSMKIKAKGNLDLSALDKIFKLKDISNPSGNVMLNTQISVVDGKTLKNIKGNFEFKDISMKLRDKQIKNASGKMAVNNNNIAIKDFTMLFGSSDLAISGALKNFQSYINKKGTLKLIATVKSDYVNLEDFMFENDEYTSQTGILPENINLNVDLKCKQFDYYTHTIKQISLNAKMLNRRLIMSNLRCEAYGGKISGTIDFDNRNSPNSVLDITTRLRNIDIQAVFKDWNNFDQKSILSENIKGQSDITAHLLIPFDPAKNLIKEKLYAQIDLKINNGELNNLASMKSITQSMKDNKMIRLFLKKHIGPLEQKLLHLKFKKLSNKIVIKDSKIEIPQMEIKTNAFDINVAGTHHFNNDINYTFDFRFKELKTKPEYTEFGKIEDDGTGFRVFLKMYGNIDDPIIEWDKASKKEKIKQDLAKEKEDLKSMLKKDFGLFNKDTTVKAYQEIKKEEEFMMYDGEFDDQGEPNLIQVDTVKTNKKKKKKINSFFNKIKEENKKEENLEFDIEN
jgi:hypothetical protein